MIDGKAAKTWPIIGIWRPKVFQVEAEELLPLWTDEVASQAVVYVGGYQAHYHREHKTKSENVMFTAIEASLKHTPSSSLFQAHYIKL